MTKSKSPSSPSRRKLAGGGKQYPGIHGKVVDFIDHKFEEDLLYIHVRFMDKTEVTFTLGSRLVIKEANLSDISTGNLKPLRTYVAYAR